MSATSTAGPHQAGIPVQPRPVANPRRRFMRISVRGLIALVLVVGAGLGWFVRATRLQREAVAAPSNAGCSVSYDWEWRDGKAVRGGKPWAPAWLVDLIGIDCFGHVAAVTLAPLSAPTPALIAQVARLTRLQHLRVSAPTLTDARLAQLKGLSKLRRLDVVETQVSDGGKEDLKQALPFVQIYD